MYDRFTRDEVSSWIWWPATMVLVVLLVLTFPGQERATDARRDDAATRAFSTATGIFAPALDDAVVQPLQGEAATAFEAVVRERALTPSWTDVVRLWGADGALLWSSDANDDVGSAGGLNDEALAAAVADPTRATQVVADRDLDGQPADATFSAYAPLTVDGQIAIAQFEVAESSLLGDVRADWLAYRIVLGIATLLTLALAIGSMREPIARIGARVPFFRTSVPRGMDVIEVERKLELERAGANARERVANMESRLRESDELRLKAEGDLQRALSQLATRSAPTRSVIPRASDVEAGSAPTPVTAPTPVATPTPAKRPTPVPDPAAASEGLTLVPSLEEPASASGAPGTSASRPARSAGSGPAESTSATPMRAEPAAGDRSAEPARGTEPPAAAEPTKRRSTERSHPSRRRPVAATTWEPAGRRGSDHGEENPPTEAPAEKPARSAKAPRTAGRDRVVVVPEPSPTARPAAAPETTGARAPDVIVPTSDVLEPSDPDARAVLERLVEPVGVSVVPAEDPSLLRAKLARTAARKKPGSRHEERLIRDDPPD